MSQNTENTDTSRQDTSNQIVKKVNLNNQNSSNLNSDLSVVLSNQEVEQLIAEGVSAVRIADCLETLLPLYAAEGITPSSPVLMAGIRQLAEDTR